MSEWNTVVAMLVLGLVAGVLSGMFGIGGGLVIVPALIICYGYGPKTATGTSLFALMWPVGLLGVVEYWKRGEMRPMPGLLIAIGLFIGAYFGARITGAISASTMKRYYGIFLLAVGCYFLYTAGDSGSGKTPANPAAKPETYAPRPIPEPGVGPVPDQVQRPPDLS
jgi:uncharacterized membrane protein YfcA